MAEIPRSHAGRAGGCGKLSLLCGRGSAASFASRAMGDDRWREMR
jgi:hypothetical protein